MKPLGSQRRRRHSTAVRYAALIAAGVSVVRADAGDAFFQPLGHLPGGGEFSWALDVSDTGSVVVGGGDSALSGSQTEAFVWTAATGMTPLGDLDGGPVDSRCNAVSADGTVVAGNASGFAFRWTAATGMVGLGDLPGGVFYALGWTISDDGKTIVGEGISDVGWEAFRWTAETGLVSLDAGVAAAFTTMAHGVSGDGTIIVGSAGNVGGAMIWDAGNGIRGIRDILVGEFGLDLTDWTLLSAEAVSADGTILVGYGINPQGSTEAWIARVPRAAGVPTVFAWGLVITGLLLLCGGTIVFSARAGRAQETAG